MDYIDHLLVKINKLLENNELPTDIQQNYPWLRDKKSLQRSDLHSSPLQAVLSHLLGYSPNQWLLEQEREQIQARRDLHKIPCTKEDEKIYPWACRNGLTGLCFSGGGIRSATFNLGVLQAMAKKGWLAHFDYLSSVSGGGYIHSWLAAWLLRESRQQENPLKAWNCVMEELTPFSDDGSSLSGEPRQIQWLRRYSNYLTPKKGILSGDTWAASAIWLRNVLLNQALLLAVFLLLLCVPHVLAPDAHLTDSKSGDPAFGLKDSSYKAGPLQIDLTIKVEQNAVHANNSSNYGNLFLQHLTPDVKTGAWPGWSAYIPAGKCAWAALLFYVCGSLFIGRLLMVEYRGTRPGSGEDALPARHGTEVKARARRGEFQIVYFLVILPLFLFGCCLTNLAVHHNHGFPWAMKVFTLLLTLVLIEAFCGGGLSHSVAQEIDRLKAEGVSREPGLWYTFRSLLSLVLLGIPAALAGTIAASAIDALLRSDWMSLISRWLSLNQSWPVQLTTGSLLFFWVAPLTMVVVSGLIGKRFPEWMGEWLGRIRGYTLMSGLGWFGLCGGSLLLPGVLLRISGYHWFTWSSVCAWAGTTAVGVLSGKSGKTTGDQHTSSSVLDWVAESAPYVYILGLLSLLSWLVYIAQNHGWVAAFYGWYLDGLALALIAYLLQSRLDVNLFSMHTFYRSRLTRCYLGASNKLRNPSPVTGFDEHDTSDLNVQDFTADQYPGPIPIFSCALNLTSGEDLAWQERKATSFAYTPYYSGYAVDWTGDDNHLNFNGYVKTCQIHPGGPRLASAVAASGAAVSPNWGYHTNPATAFLLTMFDARLGLWVPNPRRRSKTLANGHTKSRPASPPSAIAPLLKELIGSVGDSSRYVYITDGGHFDNMGMYELVRRHCYHIVICDAEEDENYLFESIGAAIRKCRIDFGVEIELNLSALVPNSKTLLSARHVLTGTIRYPGNSQQGTITYIKSSLTLRQADPAAPAAPPRGSVDLADVPGDVQAYKRKHKSFPHDSTAEQWFTESQFESYRRLGQKVAETMDSPPFFR